MPRLYEGNPGSPVVSAAVATREARHDPVRDKPRRSGRGKDTPDGITVRPGFGVDCCSMYCWHTMEIGAPPQDEEKWDGDHHYAYFNSVLDVRALPAQRTAGTRL